MNFERAIAAYAGAPTDEEADPFQRREYIVPSLWTPYHVAKRLVVSVDIIEAIVRTPGPAGHGNGWPAMLREYSDLVDEDSLRNHRAEVENAILRRKMRPTPNEIGMAEEAMLWPAQLLKPGSLDLDALMLWTLTTAKGLQITRVLARRRAQADAMIAAIQPNASPSRVTITDPDKLKGAVAGVLLTANRMLDEARAAARDARSDRAQREAAQDAVFARSFALDRLRTQVRLEALVARPAIQTIKRSEVMPGRVFTQRHYDNHRRAGAQEIADRLDAAGVTVR